MLNAFRRIIELAETEDDIWEGVEFLSEIRSDSLIDRVLLGLNMSIDDARALLLKADSFLSEREREERDILIAAYDNMVDFAVAQQYTMMADLPDNGDDIFDDVDIEEYESVFEKYNLRYAHQENMDVSYAAGMAYWWLGVIGNPIITLMTQRDERVRDTHAVLDGESFPKNEFPQSLIPPLEFGCRCYLISESGVMASQRKIFKSSTEHDPVFAESLALKGRIFTDKHSYFKAPAKAKIKIRAIADRIKQKYYGDTINT